MPVRFRSEQNRSAGRLFGKSAQEAGVGGWDEWDRLGGKANTRVRVQGYEGLMPPELLRSI